MSQKLKILSQFMMTRWFRRFKTRQQVEAYQAKQLAKQVAFVKGASPFYRKRAAESFPQMNKQQMMAHFDEINTVGLKRDAALAIAIRSEKSRDFGEKYQHIAVGLSSGTSGHQGLFITSEDEQALWAGTILAKMLPKGKLWGHRIAFFMRADNHLYETIDSAAVEFCFFDMFVEMDKNVKRLNEFQPTILVAPASVLLQLAAFVVAEQLSLTPLRVISVAEILEERDSQYLQQVFKQSVIHQIYQCTEGFLGCTCELGQLHLNEDMVKIEKERIDERRFYPIITDFKRTSQPTLNYLLNDILVEAQGPCPCGSPFMTIEKIEGRSDDIFCFLGMENQPVKVYPDFIRRCLLFVDGIREYQVIQRSEGAIEIALDRVDRQLESQIRAEFSRLSEELAFQLPQIKFTVFSPQPKVKLKRISRAF